MFYAERSCENFGQPEKGVFISIEEFAPYRALGWVSTGEINMLADAYLLELGAQELHLGTMAQDEE